MITLKRLILEILDEMVYGQHDIVVGSIDPIHKTILASDQWKTHGYMIDANPDFPFTRAFDFRFNKVNGILYWWDDKVSRESRAAVIRKLKSMGFNILGEKSLDSDAYIKPFTNKERNKALYHSHGGDTFSHGGDLKKKEMEKQKHEENPYSY